VAAAEHAVAGRAPTAAEIETAAAAAAEHALNSAAEHASSGGHSGVASVEHALAGLAEAAAENPGAAAAAAAAAVSAEHALASSLPHHNLSGVFERGTAGHYLQGRLSHQPPPAPTCSKRYESCHDSQCCADPTDGCFKSANAQFAQCRARDRTECSTDAAGATEGWICPGAWEDCAGPGQECFDSGCCSNHEFRCDKRPGLPRARCRIKELPCASSVEQVDLEPTQVGRLEIAASRGIPSKSPGCGDP
jgi:hypothetical protein